jgi:hypothetical protein
MDPGAIRRGRCHARSVCDNAAAGENPVKRTIARDPQALDLEPHALRLDPQSLSHELEPPGTHFIALTVKLTAVKLHCQPPTPPAHGQCIPAKPVDIGRLLGVSGARDSLGPHYLFKS